jgi:hypothetical protein
MSWARKGLLPKELIKLKKGVVIVSLISLLVMVAGCASDAKLRLQSWSRETMTTQQVKENWKNYHILATGLHAGIPSAIISVRIHVYGMGPCDHDHRG